jgi:[protein-PII] uridylyltransferase
VFYVTDLMGAKISAPTRQAAVKRALMKLFERDEPAPRQAKSAAG